MSTMTPRRAKAKARHGPPESYVNLIRTFALVPIQGEDELDLAIEVLDRLTARKSLNKGEQMYVGTLTLLIEAYEDVHHPIGPASDRDMLRHLMDARGIKQIQLHRETSIAKSTISEVLAGRRAFSKSIIRKLADYFGVDVSVLAANL